MKIAILTEIHHGAARLYKGIQRKLTQISLENTSDFVRTVSQSTEFTFGVHLGDIIEDLDVDSDRKNLKEALNIFNSCNKQIFHLIGNHDVKILPISEVLNEFGYVYPYYSRTQNEYHFIFLYTEVKKTGENSQISFISEEQLIWLEKELKSSQLPVVIFSHHSLADQDLTKNPWFEGRPEACLVENRKTVRDIICKYQNVRCVINGHLHWNNITLHSKIPFITIQSSVENFRDDGTPANAWAVLEITADKTSVEVYGNDRMSSQLSA